MAFYLACGGIFVVALSIFLMAFSALSSEQRTRKYAWEGAQVLAYFGCALAAGALISFMYERFKQ